MGILRISENTVINTTLATKSETSKSSNEYVNVDEVVKQGGLSTTRIIATPTQSDSQNLDDSEATKAALKQAVDAMNEFFKVKYKTSKFMYHEGLDRYYVAVVNRESEEIIKEIPPKKLLDAFYEMEKMFGIIVDEKI